MKVPQTDDTKIAVMGNNIEYIKKDMSEIKESIKGFNGIFASKEQLIVIVRETEARLGKLEASSNFWKWLSPSMSAILASVMTFLIIAYLAHK